jgi:flagellar biosynthesis/type III secretory pathway protein FliH
VVPPDAAPTSAPLSPPAARRESPAPLVPPPASPVAPLPAPPAPTPTDFSQTDAGRELEADRQHIEEVLAQVRTAVAELRQDREQRLRDWQRAAVELASTIASRLLHERVASDAFAIDSKVRDMIAALGEDVPVTVRLNPTDLQLLKQRLGDQPLLTDRADPRFVPDPAINRSGCQVEGRESMLLSDVARELQEIRDDLLRSLDHAGS